MENEKSQGSTRSHCPNRIRPTVTNLYRIGPPRLRDRTFNTVKAYVSQNNLRHNAARIKKIIGPSSALCAVVKANGYGHTARDIVSTLNKPLETSEPEVQGDGAACFAVFTIEEAEDIHPFVAAKRILVISPLFAGMDTELIKLAQARGFHCTIASAAALEYLETTLNPKPDKLNVHLKIDSGMGRLGCRPGEAAGLLELIRKSSHLQFVGVYTHFAAADEADATFTEHQQTTFEKFLLRNKLKERDDVIKHAAMAKVIAAENAFWVANEALQVMGGIGVTTKTAMERHFRDLRVGMVAVGTNEIMRLVIQREVYKEFEESKERSGLHS